MRLPFSETSYFISIGFMRFRRIASPSDSVSDTYTSRSRISLMVLVINGVGSLIGRMVRHKKSRRRLFSVICSICSSKSSVKNPVSFPSARFIASSRNTKFPILYDFSESRGPITPIVPSENPHEHLKPFFIIIRSPVLYRMRGAGSW